MIVADESTGTTQAYSESQKLALHYKELGNNPAWRPICPQCYSKGNGKDYMIKTATAGFLCIHCKYEVNCYMHKVTS